VAISTDGTTWSEKTFPISNVSIANGISDMVFGNGIFMFSTGNAIFTSTDGLAWKSTPCDWSSTLLSFGNGVFLAGVKTNNLASGDNLHMKCSTDGVDWVDFEIPVTYKPQQYYENNTFVTKGEQLYSCASDGEKILVSGHKGLTSTENGFIANFELKKYLLAKVPNNTYLDGVQYVRVNS
jgi:hypothetical protein